MSAQKNSGLDFEAMGYAIEERGVETLISFYAELVQAVSAAE